MFSDIDTTGLSIAFGNQGQKLPLVSCFGRIPTASSELTFIHSVIVIDRALLLAAGDVAMSPTRTSLTNEATKLACLYYTVLQPVLPNRLILAHPASFVVK